MRGAIRTIAVLGTLAAASASAQEWNQWRGPTRDAAVPASSTPLLWSTTGREGSHASVLLTPSHVVFLTSDGALVVARRSPKAFEEERRYQVADSQPFAMPLVLADGVIVRDATGLARLTFSE